MDVERDVTAEESLDCGIFANSRAIEIGRSALRDRLLSVDYDRLCADPGPTITSLLDFVGVSIDDVARLAKTPTAWASVGRHLQHPIAHFRRDQVEAVREMGFDVPSIGISHELRRWTSRRSGLFADRDPMSE